MDDTGQERAPQRWATGRIEAFSDGVFAIAITLLVLDIKVDPSDYDHLARALGHEWPAYLAYVTSFLTVGSIWLAHHNLFTRLRFGARLPRGLTRAGGKDGAPGKWRKPLGALSLEHEPRQGLGGARSRTASRTPTGSGPRDHLGERR